MRNELKEIHPLANSNLTNAIISIMDTTSSIKDYFSQEMLTTSINPKLVTLVSYERTAEEYAKNIENSIPEKEIKNFINRLPSRATILDIGCGSGRDAKIFSNSKLNVIGMDFSPNMLQIAQKTAPLCKFVFMDIESMYFKNETFDGIWANCSLLHIPKKELPKVLSRINDILKENGIFCLSVKKGYGEALIKDDRYGGVWKFFVYFQKDEIANFIHKARFTIIEIERTKREGNLTHSILHITAIKSLPKL